jgi:hypothetical protein
MCRARPTSTGRETPLFPSFVVVKKFGTTGLIPDTWYRAKNAVFRIRTYSFDTDPDRAV